MLGYIIGRCNVWSWIALPVLASKDMDIELFQFCAFAITSTTMIFCTLEAMYMPSQHSYTLDSYLLYFCSPMTFENGTTEQFLTQWET